jgi:hypothetical protein
MSQVGRVKKYPGVLKIDQNRKYCGGMVMVAKCGNTVSAMLHLNASSQVESGRIKCE